MRISDWSSDVCSSDLQDAQRRAHRAAHPAQMADGGLVAQPRRSEEELFDQDAFRRGRSLAVPFQNKGRDRARPLLTGLRAACYAASLDRQSVVLGKSVSVRVDLGGVRIHYKNK